MAEKKVVISIFEDEAAADAAVVPGSTRPTRSSRCSPTSAEYRRPTRSTTRPSRQSPTRPPPQAPDRDPSRRLGTARDDPSRRGQEPRPQRG